MKMTMKQIGRQDLVDNAIFDLLQKLNSSDKELEWNIGLIGEIRDVIQEHFAEDGICEESEFYY